MTNSEHDTDPSTPKSKRNSEPVAPASAVRACLAADASVTSPDDPPQAQEGTDPGLGPGGTRKTPSKRAASVVVPSVAAATKRTGPAAHDSVDVLLEGITQQPDHRARTTPQTAGQSAAAYHVEHSVRASRTDEDSKPLVVVDTPEGPPISNVVNRRGEAAAPDVSGREGSGAGRTSESLGATVLMDPARRSAKSRGPRSQEVTPVSGEAVARHMVVAAIAAIFVVAGIYLALRFIPGPVPSSVHERERARLPPVPSAVALPSSAAVPAPSATVAVPVREAPAQRVDSAPEEPQVTRRRAHPSRAAGSSHAKPAAPTSPAVDQDLG